MKRYGIDTNVLIRYLVQDDPEQSAKAVRFLEKNCTIDNPGHITLIILCEVVWVLKRAYQYPKKDILTALGAILSTAEFVIESPPAAWDAYQLYKTGSADFADYLIGCINRSNRCATTATLDRVAAKSDLFELI